MSVKESGFFKSLGRIFKGILKTVVKLVIAAAITAILGPIIGPIAAAFGPVLQPFIAQGISAGITSAVFAGRPKAFLSGFSLSLATAGLGRVFTNAGALGRFISHGVPFGVYSEVKGGSFARGFVVAGFSAAVAPHEPGGLSWKGAAFNAAVGGTLSVVGGEKFADGAVTASFFYLVRNVGYRQAQSSGSPAHATVANGVGILTNALVNVQAGQILNVAYDRPIYYRTQAEAEAAAADALAELTGRDGKEYGTIVFYDPARAADGLYGYSYSDPVEGHPGEVDIVGDIPATADARSFFHSHDVASVPDGGPSGVDQYLTGRLPAYVVGRDGKACRIRGEAYNC
jgi:hypothetical protein